MTWLLGCQDPLQWCRARDAPCQLIPLVLLEYWNTVPILSCKAGACNKKNGEKKTADGKRTEFSLCLLEQYFLVLCSSVSFNSSCAPLDLWTRCYFPFCTKFSAWHNQMFTLKFFKVMPAHTSYSPWFTSTSHNFQLFSEAENSLCSK